MLLCAHSRPRWFGGVFGMRPKGIAMNQVEAGTVRQPFQSDHLARAEALLQLTDMRTDL